MAKPITVLNLADIYAKADTANANRQTMQIRDMQMREAMEKQGRERSLRDLVAKSYMPAQQGVPFETGGEEEFMGAPSLSGLYSQAPRTGGMDYQRLAEGAAKLGDAETAMGAQSKFYQELWSTLGNTPERWEAGKQELADKYGPEIAQKIPPFSPQEADKLVRKVLSPKEYMENQRKAEYTRGLLARPAKTSAAATTVNAKLAAIKQLNLDPEEEAAAIQAVVGARAKPGGRDAAQADAIARYKAQYPLNPLTGQPPKGAPSFDEFMQMNQPAQPTKARTTPEGFEIIGENPDGSLKVRDPKTGRTGTYRP